MKLRTSPRVVRVIAPALINPLARSWRFHLRHHERWRRMVDAKKPFIFLLWHEALLPLLWQHRRQQVAIMVSEAREGQYLGDFAKRIGYQLLPGSSTRGGARPARCHSCARRRLHRIAITPDGPRGPRHDVKPGVVRAAQRANVMIPSIAYGGPVGLAFRFMGPDDAPQAIRRVVAAPTRLDDRAGHRQASSCA